MENFLSKAVEIATTAGSKLILALLIWIIGSIVVKKLVTVITGLKSMEKMDPTARSFISNFIKIALYVILVLSIISVLGVPMASVVAVLASCGVAIGMALQGALGNLAGGIMLMTFRPFKVGDYVSAAGEEGVVKDLSLFYTVLDTLDNKQVTIPNGSLMNSNVVNFSAEDLRRVDLTFNLTGAEDISKVQDIILGEVAKSEHALQDPAPFASPLEGVPGGLAYTVRVWTKNENYWDVYFDLMKKIPTALGAAGVGGPLPATKYVQG